MDPGVGANFRAPRAPRGSRVDRGGARGWSGGLPMATRTTGRAGQAARATEGTEAIEVKGTIAERHEDNALRKFGLTRANADQRRIFFYDTRKLDLYKKGVALRARELEGDECDSTVKIRPVEPDQVDAKWRK